ncbi:MAG TPA: hypothetical protein VJ111_07480 [Chitinophagaceae bacterium]|nr:hypothetical protein [Chitinophagaceae bacterium]
MNKNILLLHHIATKQKILSVIVWHFYNWTNAALTFSQETKLFKLFSGDDMHNLLQIKNITEQLAGTLFEAQKK